MSGQSVARSLARLRPQEARELLAQGSILDSCAHDLGKFGDLCRADSSVAQAAFSGLRHAVQHAAATTTTDRRAVYVARVRWASELKRLSALPSIQTSERELVQDLGRSTVTAREIDVYSSIFQFVASRAQTLYDGRWPPVEFFVRRFTHPPLRRDRYGITAETVPSAAGSPLSVILKIDPRAFGPDAFAAMPALLAHECVCHVAARPVGTVDNLSVFAEGFMDWAADFFGQMWRVDLGALGPATQEHAPRIFEAIAQSAPQGAAVRNLGRRSAHRLTQRLQRHHGLSPDAANAATANFAVRLNLVDEPILRKDKLVRDLDREGEGPLADHVLEALRGLRDSADVL
jgi:hypothetical protein